MRNFCAWLKDESGFEVFQSSALAVGGLIVAILVGGYILAITSGEYTRIENEFIGSESEANEALTRFR